MFPVFVLFGREFSMYAVMSVIGLLVAGYVFCRSVVSQKQDDTEAIVFLIVLSVGMLIGSHVLYAIININKVYRLFEDLSFSQFISVINDLFGGMVFYGGLIGAYLVGVVYVRWRNLDRELYMDGAGLFAPLFHGFARIGCFFGGCCYGVESRFGFSANGNTVTDIGEVCRFPVQLLEAGLNFLIAILICFLLKKEEVKGKVFYIYLSLYAVVRFFDEFLRGDEIRGFVFGLSTSQFISIFVEIFAIGMIVFAIKQRNEEKLIKG